MSLDSAHRPEFPLPPAVLADGAVAAQLAGLGAILDGLGVAMCVYDDADRALGWNRTFLLFFPEHDGHIHVGEDYRDNLVRFYQGRLTADEVPQIVQYIDAGVTRHRTQDKPFSFQHRGRWLRVSSKPLPGIGRMRAWTETATPIEDDGDIGAARIAPMDLFEHVADGIMVVNADDRIVWVNDHFVVLYGATGRGPLVGMTFAEVYDLAWVDALSAESRDYEAGRAALADNLRMVGAPFQLALPDDRWVRVVAQRSSAGVTYFAHVEITQLERQRRALTEKTHALESTFSSISQGIFMIGADGRLTSYNERVRELLDLPRALLDTRPTLAEMTDFQRMRGDFGPNQRLVQPHARDYVRAPDEQPSPEYYLRETPDGRVIEVKSQPLPAGGLVRTFTDVTDYVHAQEQIQTLNDSLEERVRQRTAQLQAANRELEAFSYSIAHDLRQPLSSIDGFSTLLAKLAAGLGEAKADHYASRIRAGIRQMSALTDGLLALAQLSRAKLEWKSFDLGGEAELVVQRLRELHPERRVDVVVEQGLVVRGEPVLLRQVVENLITNAWKFTARKPRAHIRVGRVLSGGPLAYYVRDDGAGFDMQYANKLFGAFQRLHSPGEFPGTGIGLATVQRIVMRHGGRVWAEAAEGEGATFYFTLGAVPAEAGA